MFCPSEGLGLSLFKSKRKESKPVDLDHKKKLEAWPNKACVTQIFKVCAKQTI